MKCSRCGRIHVGLLVYMSDGAMLLFQQEFEQWCDMVLDDMELATIRSLPLIKLPTSPLQSFLAMANSFS